MRQLFKIKIRAVELDHPVLIADWSVEKLDADWLFDISDIDECVTDPAACSQKCTNLKGGYQCSCVEVRIGLLQGYWVTVGLLLGYCWVTVGLICSRVIANPR